MMAQFTRYLLREAGENVTFQAITMDESSALALPPDGAVMSETAWQMFRALLAPDAKTEDEAKAIILVAIGQFVGKPVIEVNDGRR